MLDIPHRIACGQFMNLKCNKVISERVLATTTKIGGNIANKNMNTIFVVFTSPMPNILISKPKSKYPVQKKIEPFHMSAAYQLGVEKWI